MKTLKYILMSAVMVLLTTPVLAGNVTIPNSFTAGTPAVAADVNANFNAVQSAVNDNDTRITNMETGSVSVSGVGGFNTAAGETGCVDNKSPFYLYYSAGSNCDAMASIQIPNGVTVTGFKCTVADNNATGGAQIFVQLKRVAFSFGSQATLAATPVSVTMGSIQTLSDTTIASGLINNNLYSYFLWADFGTALGGTNVRLYGCSVSYN